MLLLRSLTQAVYQPEMEPHFGLALTAYAHFTSPIRRYPDLVVHRGIKAILAAQAQASKTPMAGNEGAVRYDEKELEAVGSSNSMTERRADEASRDVTSWLKCEYMRDKLGEVFDGRVTSVVGFGLFVELEAIFVEGLVHISSLRNDYYHFDAAHQTLTGERSAERFTLGDKIRVRVAEVDLEQRKIDFQYVERVRDVPGSKPTRGNEPTDAEIKARRMAAIRKALARDGAGEVPDKVVQEKPRRRDGERSPARYRDDAASSARGKSAGGKTLAGSAGASKAGTSKTGSAGKSTGKGTGKKASKTSPSGKASSKSDSSGKAPSAVRKQKKRGRR